jgi:acetyl-CoA carboxylase biotin carboxyl carrier protein
MAGTRKNSAPETERKMARSKASSTGNGAGGAAVVAPGIDLELIRGLIAAVDESGIDSLEIARAGTRIRISKTAPVSAAPASPPNVVHTPVGASVQPAAPARDPAEEASEAASVAERERASKLHDIKSPMVGTFYRAPAPEAPAYVELGSTVAVGQTLCILEAMKLMNELESEVEGVVREILVENADPVEFGQVLFRVEKTGAGS